MPLVVGVFGKSIPTKTQFPPPKQPRGGNCSGFFPKMDQALNNMLDRMRSEVIHLRDARARREREKVEPYKGPISAISYTGHGRFEQSNICLWKRLRDHRRFMRSIGLSGRFYNMYRVNYREKKKSWLEGANPAGRTFIVWKCLKSTRTPLWELAPVWIKLMKGQRRA